MAVQVRRRSFEHKGFEDGGFEPRSAVRRRAAGHPLRRRLLRAGVTLAVTGAAVVAAAGTASAAGPATAPQSAAPTAAPAGTAPSGVIDPELLRGPHQVFVTEMANTADRVIGPVKRLPLYPLARTTVDPLDNVLETQVADFKKHSTKSLTAPVSEGGSLSQLPVIGPLTELLPG